MDRELEIWSDSFHEGRWLLTEIGSRIHTFDLHFERGFLPVATLDFGSGRLTVRVFGDYDAWTPIPPAVKSALQFGKPDFVIYSREDDRVLFLGEETAAVPTGNQSTQRCERMVGACLQNPPIPFVYLLPDYGMHKDGNLRRTSVWPVFLAAKLTDQYKTESLVLTFGDRQHPEDYDVGDGPGLLFDLVVSILKEYMGLPASEWQPDRQRIVDRAKADMKMFATEHAPTMLDVLPKYCTSSSGGLSWPLATEVRDGTAFTYGKMIRDDVFLRTVYGAVSSRRAYTLSSLAGSKPQSLKKLESYKSEHVNALKRHKSIPSDYGGYDVEPSSFPVSENGNYHVTSSKDIVFMLDDGDDIAEAYKTAFGRLGKPIDRLTQLLGSSPAFLYTSASMKKGRVLGDPYTGQLPCFAKVLAFDHANQPIRTVVAYFPLQSVATFPSRGRSWTTSKGLRLYKHVVDVIICHGGILVFPKTSEIV